MTIGQCILLCLPLFIYNSYYKPYCHFNDTRRFIHTIFDENRTIIVLFGIRITMCIVNNFGILFPKDNNIQNVKNVINEYVKDHTILRLERYCEAYNIKLFPDICGTLSSVEFSPKVHNLRSTQSQICCLHA